MRPAVNIPEHFSIRCSRGAKRSILSPARLVQAINKASRIADKGREFRREWGLNHKPR